MLFPFERFRFTIKVSSLMVLPPYKGAVFRGAFGNAFRRVVCAVPRADCAACILRQKCLYVSIFEPPPPANYPDAAKFSQAGVSPRCRAQRFAGFCQCCVQSSLYLGNQRAMILNVFES